LAGAKKYRNSRLHRRHVYAEEALRLGLVHDVAMDAAELETKALSIARQYADRDAAAFCSIKKLLRKPCRQNQETGT